MAASASAAKFPWLLGAGLLVLTPIVYARVTQRLRALGLPGAWLAAAIFAAHPVMVETSDSSKMPGRLQ
jgi:hypothetical protein